jgi:hypothetical protein
MADAELQDASFNAVGQRHRVEVDQQADAAWAEAKIGQKLRFVQWLSAFDRLEFEDNLAVYDDVGDIAAIEKNVVVRDGEWYLALERYALLAEFVAKAPFIDGFEQAGAEAAVHAHGQADDPVREVSVVAGVLIHGGQVGYKQLDDALTGLVGWGRKQSRSTQITQIKSQITQKGIECALRAVLDGFLARSAILFLSV